MNNQMKAAIILVGLGLAACIGGALAHSTSGTVMGIVVVSFGLIGLVDG